MIEITNQELQRGALFFDEKDDGWFNFFTETESYDSPLDIHITELANIPQVKALIEALEESKCILDLCYDYGNGEKEKLDDALAPFKMSPGNNEQ